MQSAGWRTAWGLETEQGSVANRGVTNGMQFANEFACAGIGNLLPEWRGEKILVVCFRFGIHAFCMPFVVLDLQKPFLVLIPKW